MPELRAAQRGRAVRRLCAQEAAGRDQTGKVQDQECGSVFSLEEFLARRARADVLVLCLFGCVVRADKKGEQESEDAQAHADGEGAYQDGHSHPHDPHQQQHQAHSSLSSDYPHAGQQAEEDYSVYTRHGDGDGEGEETIDPSLNPSGSGRAGEEEYVLEHHQDGMGRGGGAGLEGRDEGAGGEYEIIDRQQEGAGVVGAEAGIAGGGGLLPLSLPSDHLPPSPHPPAQQTAAGSQAFSDFQQTLDSIGLDRINPDHAEALRVLLSKGREGEMFESSQSPFPSPPPLLPFSLCRATLAVVRESDADTPASDLSLNSTRPDGSGRRRVRGHPRRRAPPRRRPASDSARPRRRGRRRGPRLRNPSRPDGGDLYFVACRSLSLYTSRPPTTSFALEHLFQFLRLPHMTFYDHLASDESVVRKHVRARDNTQKSASFSPHPVALVPSALTPSLSPPTPPLSRTRSSGQLYTRSSLHRSLENPRSLKLLYSEYAELLAPVPVSWSCHSTNSASSPPPCPPPFHYPISPFLPNIQESRMESSSRSSGPAHEEYRQWMVQFDDRCVALLLPSPLPGCPARAVD